MMSSKAAAGHQALLNWRELLHAQPLWQRSQQRLNDQRPPVQLLFCTGEQQCLPSAV